MVIVAYGFTSGCLLIYRFVVDLVGLLFVLMFTLVFVYLLMPWVFVYSAIYYAFSCCCCLVFMFSSWYVSLVCFYFC